MFSETISSGPHLRSKNSTPSLILLVLGLLCLVRDFGGRSSNASQHPGCRYINRREVQLRAGVLKISPLYITAFSLLSPFFSILCPLFPSQDHSSIATMQSPQVQINMHRSSSWVHSDLGIRFLGLMLRSGISITRPDPKVDAQLHVSSSGMYHGGTIKVIVVSPSTVHVLL